MHFWSRRRFKEWFEEQTGVEIRAAWVMESATDFTSFNAVLDYGLELKPIKLDDANVFIEQYHRHNGRINQFKLGAGIWNGPEMIGLVTVEPPRARMLKDRRRTVEVTRVCIRADIEPQALVANACLMAYGWACREAGKKGYRKVITYTRVGELARSLRAAGFEPVYRQMRAKVWSCKSRPRSKPKSPPVPKIRWERLVA